MVFINEGQTSQVQQANQEAILLAKETAERLLETFFLIAQALMEQKAKGKEKEEKTTLTLEQQVGAVDFVASASSLAMDSFTWNEETKQLEYSYESDSHQLKVEMGEDITARYSVLDAAGQCCFHATKSLDKPLSIEHMASNISPDQLKQWSGELEKMKSLHDRRTKNMEWAKKCHQQAPTWCPAGTSATLVADQVLSFKQTDNLYSDKTGLTFTRTKDGISMTRNDGTVACQFGPQGITSNLTPEETAYFRTSYQQYSLLVAAQSIVSATPVQQTNGAAKTSKGFERTPFE